MTRRLDPAKDFKAFGPPSKYTNDIDNIYPRLVWTRFKDFGYPIRDGCPSITKQNCGTRFLQEIKLGDICQLRPRGRVARRGHYLDKDIAMTMDPELRVPTLSEVYPNYDRVIQRAEGEPVLKEGCYTFSDDVKRTASSGISA
jgi:hypothetical protein